MVIVGHMSSKSTFGAKNTGQKFLTPKNFWWCRNVCPDSCPGVIFGAGRGGAELKIFGAGAPRGSHFPRGRGGAGRASLPLVTRHWLTEQRATVCWPKPAQLKVQLIVSSRPETAQQPDHIFVLLKFRLNISTHLRWDPLRGAVPTAISLVAVVESSVPRASSVPRSAIGSSGDSIVFGGISVITRTTDTLPIPTSDNQGTSDVWTTASGSTAAFEPMKPTTGYKIDNKFKIDHLLVCTIDRFSFAP